MSLKNVENNRIIAQQLSKQIAAGKTVHAYLFIGPEKDRLELGTSFAGALLCLDRSDDGDSCGRCLSCRKFEHENHEDYIFTGRTENRQSLVVSQIEELQEKLAFKSFGTIRVALIEEAHLLNTAAQNKLLKTLEEPPAGTVLILLAESREAMLPTIISRCSCFYLQEMTPVLDPHIAEMAAQFVRLVVEKAPFYRKKECICDIINSKDDPRIMALEFLAAFEDELAGMLGKSGPMTLDALTEAIRLTEEAQHSLRLSYNTGYVLKGLCLKI